MEVSSGCGLGVWGVSFSFGETVKRQADFREQVSEGEVKEGRFLPAGFEGGGGKW